MKVLSVLVLFCSISAHAETPCKGKAVQAALSKYLENGIIQGDEPTPNHSLIKTTKTSITHAVAIDGQNDEGESWTITYQVKTKLAPSCKVTSVKEVANH